MFSNSFDTVDVKDSDTATIRSLLTKLIACTCTDQNINIDGQYFGVGSEKMTGLMIATAAVGLSDLVTSLLDHQADVNIKTNNYVGTALSLAVYYGNIEIITTLLDHKADVDIKDIDGFTALMWAARNGHNEVVTILLDHKADVDIKANDGRTALIYAARNGNNVVVTTLLDHKADVDIKDDKYGFTALMWAAYNGRNEVVTTLLDHKADVDIKARYGQTALQLAVIKGHTDTVKILQTKSY